MAKRNHFFNNEKGSISIILVLSLVGLLGISALVIDAGTFYVSDMRLSNSVDAAVLAGAQDLFIGSLEARAAAEEYAAKNGLSLNNMEIYISNDNSSITVKGRQEAPLFFGRLLMDDETLRLEKSATAMVGNVSAMTGVAPLGIQKHDFIYGHKYTLKIAAGDDYDTGLGVGNFGALALGGGGSSTYEKNLTEGYTKPLSIGDVINTETGNMSNPTKRSIDKRITQSQSTSYEDVPRGCPRVLYIPVFEVYEMSTNQVKSVKIVGFAAFWVDEVIGQGNESYINGYFIKMLASGDISDDADYYGLKTIKLIN